MKVTPELRKYAIDNLGVAADASDDDVRKVVGDAITKGTLTVDKLNELTTVKATEAENRLAGMIDDRVGKAVGEAVGEAVTKAVGGLTEKLDAMVTTLEKPNDSQADSSATPSGDKAAGTGDQTDSQATDPPPDTATPSAGPNPQKAFDAAAQAAGGDGASTDDGTPGGIRGKSIVEHFSDTRTAATWEKSIKDWNQKSFGHQRVQTGNDPQGLMRDLDMPTDRTKAIAGAWMKHMINRAFRSGGRPVPPSYKMSKLDQKLVEYAVHNCKFVGPHGWNEDLLEADHWFDGFTKVTSDLHKKALLDDSTSGGLEAVPIEFDDVAILTPLLNGELFPYVGIRNVTRRRIEGFSVGNPTLSWGTSEGSQISLFDTDSLIAAFDNTIYPLTGSIEIGLDFEADSPVGVGNIIMSNYGERFREEMDNVIAANAGTTAPQGVLYASGISAITPSGGAGAAQTVADYEGLMFGVKKQYRAEARPGNQAVFIGTETSYQRARSIVVSATDQRRVFGMETNTHEAYSILGHRYAINESLSNAQILFCCLNRYRLYRRQGFEVRVVTEDKELARKNQRLILVRARFGGKLELSGAATKITNGQA